MASIDARSCDVYPSVIHNSESECSVVPITRQQGFAAGISYCAPRLKVHREAEAAALGREVLVDIGTPGLYAILAWTDAEWALLSQADRPKQAYRHGSCWFSLARRVGAALMLSADAWESLIV